MPTAASTPGTFHWSKPTAATRCLRHLLTEHVVVVSLAPPQRFGAQEAAKRGAEVFFCRTSRVSQGRGHSALSKDRRLQLRLCKCLASIVDRVGRSRVKEQNSCN